VSLLTELDAFYTEHRRCGELDGDVDEVMVWLACDCGAPATPSVLPEVHASQEWLAQSLQASNTIICVRREDSSGAASPMRYPGVRMASREEGSRQRPARYLSTPHEGVAESALGRRLLCGPRSCLVPVFLS
jgi:hypothetical protein